MDLSPAALEPMAFKKDLNICIITTYKVKNPKEAPFYSFLWKNIHKWQKTAMLHHIFNSCSNTKGIYQLILS